MLLNCNSMMSNMSGKYGMNMGNNFGNFNQTHSQGQSCDGQSSVQISAGQNSDVQVRLNGEEFRHDHGMQGGCNNTGGMQGGCYGMQGGCYNTGFNGYNNNNMNSGYFGRGGSGYFGRGGNNYNNYNNRFGNNSFGRQNNWGSRNFDNRMSSFDDFHMDYRRNDYFQNHCNKFRDECERGNWNQKIGYGPCGDRLGNDRFNNGSYFNVSMTFDNENASNRFHDNYNRFNNSVNSYNNDFMNRGRWGSNFSRDDSCFRGGNRWNRSMDDDFCFRGGNRWNRSMDDDCCFRGGNRWNRSMDDDFCFRGGNRNNCSNNDCDVNVRVEM